MRIVVTGLLPEPSKLQHQGVPVHAACMAAEGIPNHAAGHCGVKGSLSLCGDCGWRIADPAPGGRDAAACPWSQRQVSARRDAPTWAGICCASQGRRRTERCNALNDTCRVPSADSIGSGSDIDSCARPDAEQMQPPPQCAATFATPATHLLLLKLCLRARGHVHISSSLAHCWYALMLLYFRYGYFLVSARYDLR
jgi:hypothetical protein